MRTVFDADGGHSIRDHGEDTGIVRMDLAMRIYARQHLRIEGQ